MDVLRPGFENVGVRSVGECVGGKD